MPRRMDEIKLLDVVAARRELGSRKACVVGSRHSGRAVEGWSV